jgi:hypothetical protein
MYEDNTVRYYLANKLKRVNSVVKHHVNTCLLWSTNSYGSSDRRREVDSRRAGRRSRGSHHTPVVGLRT